MLSRHQCAICERATARPQLCVDCQARINADLRWQRFIVTAFEVVAILTIFALALALVVLFG